MDLYGCLVISVLFSVVMSAHHSMNDAGADEISYRIPNNTKPENYDITLVTNIHKNDFKFSGTVIINLRALETSYNIVLHARQLVIKSVKLMTQTGTNVRLNPFIFDAITEFLTIPTQSQLQEDNNYILTIEYSGELRTDQHGFYRSSYVNSQGEIKWLATTQLEPTDARHAFPCYDEPGLKAKFIIHIEHGESYHAISNMKEKRNEALNGQVITDFDETPLMSTYLIAFIISDFEYKEFSATNAFLTTQRVFTSKNKINQTAYALGEGPKLLKAIENLIQVPFTLPKLDQAAVPDFGVEAMENWGLVTYEEKYLLFSPADHLLSRKLDITYMIAHEFSHQWFGNLVSPKWWSYLWLNEGFATLFETLASDLVHPEWNVFNYFIVSRLQPVLRVDAQPKTRPMTFYVESQDAISKVFDDIAYEKAGSVARMFMHALGEETFRNGLNYYLTNNSFSVADEDTLLRSLDSAAKEDKALPDHLNVKDLFGSWSNQKGFPLLKVTRDYEDGSVALYQEKYNAILEPTESSSSTWWIPYNFASAKSPIFNGTTPFGWLAKDQRDVVIKPNETGVTWTNDDWLVFNIQQTGFYRVFYDVENYNLINEELNDGDLNKIHPINRAQILDDLQDFVIIGRISPEVLCNTLTYLKKEMSYAPWETARKAIGEWNQKLQTSEKLSNFGNFVASLVEPYFKKWTLNEAEREEVFDKLSRSTAVNLACEFGVSRCLEDTYAKFEEVINGTNIPQNIRGLVVTNGIRSATDDEIAQLWQIFLNSPYNDERNEIISSIGNIPRESTVQFYLNKSIEDFGSKGVSASERLLLVKTVIGSGQRGVSLGIQFLSKNLDKVNSTIGSVPTILSSIVGQILTKEMAAQFSKLLDLAKQMGLLSDEDVGIFKDTMRENLNWQNNILKAFENGFFDGKCTGSHPSYGGIDCEHVPAHSS